MGTCETAERRYAGNFRNSLRNHDITMHVGYAGRHETAPERLWRLPGSNHEGAGPNFEMRSEPQKNLRSGIRRGEKRLLRQGQLREKPRQFEARKNEPGRKLPEAADGPRNRGGGIAERVSLEQRFLRLRRLGWNRGDRIFGAGRPCGLPESGRRIRIPVPDTNGGDRDAEHRQQTEQGNQNQLLQGKNAPGF